MFQEPTDYPTSKPTGNPTVSVFLLYKSFKMLFVLLTSPFLQAEPTNSPTAKPTTKAPTNSPTDEPTLNPTTAAVSAYLL